ncbi:MAG: hypothetical protein Cons2KO_34100 [Congregibacter sp.]
MGASLIQRQSDSDDLLTRGGARLLALWLLIFLASCSSNPSEYAHSAYEAQIAAAQAQAAEQAAAAEEARREAAEAASRVADLSREADEARAAKEALSESLETSTERLSALEIKARQASSAARNAEQQLQAAREQIDAMEQVAASDSVVPREELEAALQQVEALRESQVSPPQSDGPEYEVTFRGPEKMVLDRQFAISIEVTVPAGAPAPDNTVFQDNIDAVSNLLQANLHGSHFEIVALTDFKQSMSNGSAVWDFNVKPLAIGDQTLHATVVQYDEADEPSAARTNDWEVQVSVNPASGIIETIARNMGEFAIGIIMFFGGMIAEFLRRRFLGTNKS